MNEKSTGRDITIPFLIAGAISLVGTICLCVGIVFAANYWKDDIQQMAESFAPTPVPCPIVPANWTAKVNDDLSENISGWGVGREDDDYADVELLIEGGNLKVISKAHQGSYAYYIPSYNNSMKRDFYLRTNVRQTSGPADGEYGVIFNAGGGDHYYFSISNEGDMTVYRHLVSGGEEPWTTLYRGQAVNLIQPEQYNELVVLGEGTRFTFCVNQQFLTTFEDKSLTNGKYGIGTMLHHENDQAVVDYDKFEVYLPSK